MTLQDILTFSNTRTEVPSQSPSFFFRVEPLENVKMICFKSVLNYTVQTIGF